ncbi:MAG: FAD-dependent oxidoreductase [Desulfobacterales bacterium]|nr:FAD-dependent oxidoreductase [Desulfobacterales bacterium]
MPVKQMLIIGASDAGISAALRIRELAPEAEVTVMAKDAYPNFSICGLPFYLSGEVTDWRKLAHRTAKEITEQGIRLLLDHEATAVDPAAKQVSVRAGGDVRRIEYDKLLIATGAESIKPPIEGLDAPGVFFLRWMADSFAIKRFMDQKQPKRAVVIGGGYIGLEMADALTRRQIAVTLVEFAPEVLSTLDPDLGQLIRAELESGGVRVITGKAVQRISQNGSELRVHTDTGETEAADMVLTAAGARPAADLAQTAGIGTGAANAISVDRTMATQIPGIWAAGDCAQTWHRILERHVYLPLGTTAHKQGRVAGENMLGGSCEFQGSLGTQAVKVFDRVAARTGLKDKDAAEAGFDPLTVPLVTPDHKAYYPGANHLHIRITGDRSSGRLLGAQMVGHRTSEVSKRIDILAAALYHKMHVRELCNLDLSYTPPLSSPWDPVQAAAMTWCGSRGKQH